MISDKNKQGKLIKKVQYILGCYTDDIVIALVIIVISALILLPFTI